jgi:hypothetical protein
MPEPTHSTRPAIRGATPFSSGIGAYSTETHLDLRVFRVCGGLA